MKTMAEAFQEATATLRGADTHVAKLMREAMNPNRKRRSEQELRNLQAQEARERAQRAAAWEEEQRRAWPEHLRRCGVPARERDVLLSSLFRETPATRGVREFLKGRWSFCVLIGHNGVGKSVAASLGLAAARRPAARSYDGFLEWDSGRATYIDAGTFKALNPYDERDRNQIDRTLNDKVVVLDNLGLDRSMTPQWVERIELFFLRRYALGAGGRCRTVITTTLPPSDLAQKYDTHCISRLEHDAFIVDCGKTSLRQSGE